MANIWKTVVVIIAAALTITGCAGGDTGYKQPSQGAPYELVVVAGHAEWDGAVGDTLRAMFQKRFPMVNREEPRFDVLRTLPEGFKRLITRHRNIIIINVDKQYAEPSLELLRDVYAKGQVVLVAKAADDAAMLDLVNTERENIMLLLEHTERERDVELAKGYTPEAIKTLIKEKFGFEMGTGSGFTVRSQSDNFLWLSYEMPTASQGIIIYDYPFSGLKDFDRENLLHRRDEFVARIPGENPGSHMITNHEYIDLVYKKIDDRRWSELHGFWDVKGDFMGGPFVNFSTLDAPNQRVVAIDFYVYSPNPQLKQRNYKKQLEHYLYTVKFPSLQP